MNSIELRSALKTNDITKDCFGEILASDQLPKTPLKQQLRSPKYYIVNFDPSTKSGSHWIVCFFTNRKDKRNIYFDSYGYPPMIDSISHFLGEDAYYYNSKQLQHPLTSSCGQWCLFFIYYHLLNKNNEQRKEHFINLFKNTTLLQNDKKINNWVNQTFNLNEKIIDKHFLTNQIAKTLLDNQNFPFYT